MATLDRADMICMMHEQLTTGTQIVCEQVFIPAKITGFENSDLTSAFRFELDQAEEVIESLEILEENGFVSIDRVTVRKVPSGSQGQPYPVQQRWIITAL